MYDFDGFLPVTGRVLDESLPVDVYRNLNNGKLSIRQKGIVYGYCNRIMLQQCRFVVSEAGRNRVLREQRKNVHAYITGYLVPFASDEVFVEKEDASVTYNPYNKGYFYFRETEEAVYETDKAVVYSDGRMFISEQVHIAPEGELNHETCAALY